MEDELTELIEREYFSRLYPGAHMRCETCQGRGVVVSSRREAAGLPPEIPCPDCIGGQSFCCEGLCEQPEVTPEQARRIDEMLAPEFAGGSWKIVESEQGDAAGNVGPDRQPQ